MDRTPGGGPSDSINHHDFSPDEIEVATTLTRLNSLIPLYEFRNRGFLPPLWGSRLLRSACAPDRQGPESVAATACPVIPYGSNLRNISPDSPLLLKASPTSGGGAQGSSPGIAAEPRREKEEETERRNVKKGRTGSEELKVQVDFGWTIPGQLSVSQVTRDPSSSSDPLPNGGAHASPSSPLLASKPMLLFDLNLTPPDCLGIQSSLPDEDGTPGLSPSDGEIEVNGSNKTDATRATGQKRFRDMEGEIPNGCCTIGHQGTEPRFRQWSMDVAAVDAPEHRFNQTPGAMPVDEPKPAQMVDPDGWTMVGARKNNSRSAPCFLPYGFLLAFICVPDESWT